MNKIKILSSYARLEDNDSRYVAVLQDNSIWWFAPGYPWQPSTTEGLPEGYNIDHLVAYSRSNKDGTRYVAVLHDGSIWWFAPGYPWQQSSVEGMEGLPLNAENIPPTP